MNIESDFLKLWDQLDAFSKRIMIKEEGLKLFKEIDIELQEICNKAVQLEQINQDLKGVIQDYREAYEIVKTASEMKSEVIQTLKGKV